MRYLALCTDYDGTLAHHGRVADSTCAALERLRASGRRIVLVTGRQLDDLRNVCPKLELFDCVVAENGAVLHRPAAREEKVLAGRPPQRFIDALRERGVEPLSVGRVIVATWEPHHTTVLETIRELGLELQVIFNKGAVMVLPAGVNKATGLAAALDALGLSPHNAVGIGDAENDHAFLDLCECAVAVSNALPLLKERADLVTQGDHGAGVEELVGRLLKDDLASLEERLTRHHVLLGRDARGEEVRMSPHGTNILLVGTSGSGKSTLATGILERLVESRRTFCIIDPEGDYDTLQGAVTLGTAERPPGIDEMGQLLAKPGASCVLNLVALPITDRPAFFEALLPRLQELRARTGRPHWLVIDEAHHLLPAARRNGGSSLPERLENVLQITVHPNLIAASALAQVDTVIAVGMTPEAMMREFCETLGECPPALEPVRLEAGEALVWLRRRGRAPFRLVIEPSRTERRRHTRKYAEGELGPDRSFYFRGPEGRLNLRAQNLLLFLQLAEGVDDDTWLHHLRGRDYSRWIRDCIKDRPLAEEVAEIENRADTSPQESRRLIRRAIESRYTLPA
ncbi:MAG: HAD family hydrolase [Pseudomonadota bacterium]|nr:MAG: phosphoglycolate phosphatase [Pseudomonadota bacterium]